MISSVNRVVGASLVGVLVGYMRGYCHVLVRQAAVSQLISLVRVQD